MRMSFKGGWCGPPWPTPARAPSLAFIQRTGHTTAVAMGMFLEFLEASLLAIEQRFSGDL